LAVIGFVTVGVVFASSVDAGAQQLDTVLTLATGTGLSLGKPGAELAMKTSPAFLEVDVGLIIDGDRDWEWTPSLIVEVGGRVSVGINPSVKRMLRFKWFSVYGGVGLPFFFAPYTLLGAEVAVGGIFHIIPRIGVTLEFRTDVFFVGSDLPNGSVLAKLDFALGLRINL
jgi:hypothetical protein